MNGIDDLRRTLETHADDVRDVDASARGAGVRHRVRAARRRRVAGVATAGVVAVAAVFALVPADPGRDGGPDVAGPTVFGVDLPEELESLGFTYDYADHVRGDRRVDLDLAGSDAPRLVSWGTSTGDDRVVVTVGAGSTAQTYDGPDFADWTYVAPGDALQVSARVGTGEVSLAVYTLGEGRPAGVTAQGVTFRATRAGAPLLGAAIGEPGQAEVVVEATGRASDLFYSYYCVGGPANATLHIASAGGEVTFGRCDDTVVPVDPAALGGVGLPAGPREDLTTRLFVTAGPRGPRVESDDLRIGLGLYAQPDDRDLGAGIGLPERVEHDGHAWQLARTASPDLGSDGAVATVPDLDGPVLALVDYTRADESRVGYEVDGDGGDSTSYVGGGTFTVDLPPGARQVGLARLGGEPIPARAAVGFGFYVRAD